MYAKSEKYYPANLLAQPFFSNGYTARYVFGGEEVQAFFVLSENAESAREAFNKYRASLEDGKRKFTVADTGEDSFLTTDSFYGKIMTATSGAVTAGVLGKFDDAAGKDLLAGLLAGVGKLPRSSTQ